MSSHKNSDYKLSEIKYYLSNSKNNSQSSQIVRCPEKGITSCHDKNMGNNFVQKLNDNNDRINEKIFSINYII